MKIAYKAKQKLSNQIMPLTLPLGIISGILCYYYITIEPNTTLSIIVLIITSIIAIGTKNHSYISIATTALFAISLGFTAHTIHTKHTPTNILPNNFCLHNTTGTISNIQTNKNNTVFTVSNIESKQTHPIQNLKIISHYHKHQNIELNSQIMFSACTYKRHHTSEYPERTEEYLIKSYMDQISGYAYLIKPPHILTTPINASFLHRIKETINRHINETMNQTNSSIATALITGTKQNIDNTLRDKISRAGLAHILAISGLHMSIVAGITALIARYTILIMAPKLSLKYNISYLITPVVIITTGGYLLLTGTSLSAQRAFLMTTTAWVALCTQNQKDILRSISAAMSVMLLIKPHSLLSAGFQMSFAAIIAVTSNALPHVRAKNKITNNCLQTAKCSLFATIATAPFVAYHFNHISLSGIISNIIAIPITSLVIMPAGVLGVILIPISSSKIPFKIMEYGIEALLHIANLAADLPGNYILIPHITNKAFVIISGGTVLSFIAPRRHQKIPIILVLIGLVINLNNYKPDILMFKKTIAVRESDGKIYFIKKHNKSSAIKRWLRQNAQHIPETKFTNGQYTACNANMCRYTKNAQTTTIIKKIDKNFQCNLLEGNLIVINLSNKEIRCTGQNVINHSDTATFITIKRNGNYILQNNTTPKRQRPWTQNHQ